MMDSRLQLVVANARLADMRRAAQARGRHERPERADLAASPVTLRLCSADDQLALGRLAELDCAAAPTQPVLLAEVDGKLRAAVSLVDGAVTADPFYPTAVLVELLHARARQLDAFRGGRRRRLRGWRRAVVQSA